MRRPKITIESLSGLLPALGTDGGAAVSQIETEMKYQGYIARAQDDIDRLKRHAGILLPRDFDDASISGLSVELKQKLEAARPDSLERASHIPGITPAALSILLVHVRKARATA